MKKRGLWVIIGLLVAMGAIVFALTIEKVTVTASSIALVEQGWRANFSTSLKAASVDTDDLYVMNEKGERMPGAIKLEGKGQSLLVKGVAPGAYTLHIDKNAVKGNKRLKFKEVQFSIQEKIESVKSDQELKTYFKQVMATQTQRQSTVSESAANFLSGSMKDTAHSTTNNQVEGIDEADHVKTDGDFIYSLIENGKVIITDIRNPRKLVKASEIKGEEAFSPSQLFLQDDTLIVLGEKYEPFAQQASENKQMKMMPMNGMTMVRIYNVVDKENPVLIREVGTEGYLNGARKTEDVLYLITNVHPNFWSVDDIDSSTLRPYVYDSVEGEEYTLIDYADISILPGAMEPTYSVITTIDLSSPAENKVVTKGYLGGSSQLYMSAENLYLTATLYKEEIQKRSLTDTMISRPGNVNTELFKFSLDGTDVTFQNSAELKGNLLNQFSMDEHDGYFRVVTTEGAMWDDKNPSKNHLFILDENLRITGSVEGLAKGERIYSARFMGDKAYMVTFRETDPLFVIDVENPVAPKVLGELKIPGFSNYLHPLDENHLIGFGYETTARKNPDGGEPFIVTLGMKISLFDVSDFANPQEKDTEIIGGQGTYSPIQHDHKALFQHGERGLYGFPVMVYGGDEKFLDIELKSSGALIYEITPEKGIVLQGNLLEAKMKGQQYDEYGNEIQRILYSGDMLYTVSMNKIEGYTLDEFLKVGHVELQE